MNDRKVLLGLAAVLFLAALGGFGCGVFYYMELQKQEDALAALEEEKQALTSYLEGTKDELLQANNKIKSLEKELKKLQHELAGKDDEMRSQRERFRNDSDDRLARERRRSQELEGMVNQQRGGRRGFDLEKLKTEDPERYQRIMARREEMQKRRDRRNALVANLDLSKLSPEQRQNVQRFQELQAQMEAQREKMRDMSDEERRNAMREGFESMREMSQLQNSVRDAIVEQAVQSGDSAAAKDAVQMFQNGGPGGPGGGPGGGRGGWGGNGGGPGGPPPGF